MTRQFPRSTSHAVAEVTSDACVGFSRRRIAASITYRDGDPSLLRGDQVLFEASRGRGLGCGTYTLTLSGGGVAPRTYVLAFRSPYFDAVEFEVDRVENAGDVVTTVDTGAHPSRPGDLPHEVISLTSVFQRAGFDATVSPHETTIALADAGANGTWSDAEMHDAMVTYWARFEFAAYAFMEPVTIELKLTNDAGRPAMVDPHLLEDGRHVTIFLQHEGGDLRRWRPRITRCHEERADALKPGESSYGAHTISASPDGWLIDEPGFYEVQAALDLGDEIVVSNVLRLHVAPPTTADERESAPAYFTEDVARALAFGGSPSLVHAMDTLRAVVARVPHNPAAVHAALALSTPMLRDFKRLELGAEPADMAIRSDAANVTAAVEIQTDALLDAPDRAAATLGHIAYFEAVDDLVDALASDGDATGAKKVLQESVKTMERRGVLTSVIAAAQRKVGRLA